MKYFLLKMQLEDAIGVPTRVIVDQDKVDTEYYQKKINNSDFWTAIAPVYLKLMKWKGTPHKLRDYHYWNLGQPDGFQIVCSSKFRKVLETLTLPKHIFYDAEILVSKKIHNYFVLHFIQDWAKDIDYSKSVFDVVAYMEDDRLIKRLEVGEVKSFKNYEEIIEMQVEVQHYLYPAKLHFLPHINYDIWGLHGQIILSEKAKQAIEQAGITGVEMPEIQDLSYLRNIEITMNNQTYCAAPQTKTVQYENKPVELIVVAEPETPYNKKP